MPKYEMRTVNKKNSCVPFHAISSKQEKKGKNESGKKR